MPHRRQDRQPNRKCGPCVYCGSVGPLTDDHIPPRCLFPDQRPSDLITVPACKPCNHGFHKDDEYLRAVLVMNRDSWAHPAVPRLWPSIRRSLRREKAPHWRRLIYGSLRIVENRSPAGLYLGRSPGLSVETPRLLASAERIARGLYWHHEGRTVPEGYRCRAIWLQHPAAPKRDAQIREAMIWAARGSGVDLGAGVFEYQFRPAADLLDAAVVAMRLYRAVDFLVGIGPDMVDEGLSLPASGAQQQPASGQFRPAGVRHCNPAPISADELEPCHLFGCHLYGPT